MYAKNARRYGKFILGLLCLASLAHSANAYEYTTRAKIRDGKDLTVESVTLTDLISDKAFDGAYFKIVENDSEDAVKFDADKELVLRAATAYHHMSIARGYYKSILPQSAHLDEKIVVRIEQILPYSETDHFVRSMTTNKKGKEVPKLKFNNARSIRASDDMRNEETDELGNELVPAWGKEVWFHKAKKIRYNNNIRNVTEQVTNRDFKNMLLGTLLQQDAVAMSNDLIMMGPYFDISPHIASMLLSFGISELIPDFIKLVGKFAKQTLYLDTVMYPEVIYHEYGHIALEPWLDIKTSTAVVEGFPNYFAWKISGDHKLQRGGWLKHRRSYHPLNAKKGGRYNNYQEVASGQESPGLFVYSVLFRLDEAFGGGDEALQIISGMVLNRHLNRSSKVRSDFLDAIGLSIDDYTKNERERTRLKLLSAGVIDDKF